MSKPLPPPEPPKSRALSSSPGAITSTAPTSHPSTGVSTPQNPPSTVQTQSPAPASVTSPSGVTSPTLSEASTPKPKKEKADADSSAKEDYPKKAKEGTKEAWKESSQKTEGSQKIDKVSSTPVKEKEAKKEKHHHHHEDYKKKKRVPCPPHLCTLVPTDVPAPEYTKAVLHPRKDVFVLKIAKVGPNGDRRCRMELELVTPKSPDKTPPYRIETRETQCDPECDCCCSKYCGRRKN